MGKDFELDNLNIDDGECEKILKVIQRDFELRQKEKDRLEKVEYEIEKEKSKIQLLSESRNFNDNCCIRCFSKFVFIFNSKLVCDICGYNVCKKCTYYKASDKKYICNACDKLGDLETQNLHWFYSNLKTKFKCSGSAKIVRYLFKGKDESDSDGESNSIPVRKKSERVRPSLGDVFSANDDNTIVSVHGYDIIGNESSITEFNKATKRYLIAFKEELSLVVKDVNRTLGENSSMLSSHTADQIRINLEDEGMQITIAISNLVRNLHSEAIQLSIMKSENFTSIHAIINYLVKHEIELIVAYTIEMPNNISYIIICDESNNSQILRMLNVLTECILNKIIQEYKKLNEKLSLIEETIIEEECLSNDEEIPVTVFDVPILESKIDESQLLFNEDKFTNSVEIDAMVEVNMLSDDSGTHLDTESPQLSEGTVEYNSLCYDMDETDNFNGQMEPFHFVLNHKPCLPNFDDNDDLMLPGFDSNDLEVSHLSVAYENNRPVTPTIDSEILFGSTWIPRDSSKDIFSPNRVSAYDNFGRKSFGRSETLLMTIPNSKDDYSPRIGDTDADDLSDLSENEEGTLELADFEDSNEFYSEETFDYAYQQAEEEAERLLDMEYENNVVNEKNDLSTSKVSENDKTEIIYNIAHDAVEVEEKLEPIKIVSNMISNEPEPEEKTNEEDVDPEDADPRFIQRPKTLSTPIGETAKFTCQVSGSEPLDVYWYRDDDDQLILIEDNEKYETSFLNGSYRMEVFNTENSDIGRYMCITINEKAKTHGSMRLKVTQNNAQTQAPQFLKGIQDVDVEEGYTVKFRCKIRGYPQPRVCWYKDGKLIQKSENILIEKIGNRDYLLTVENATLDDDAEYLVIAKNCKGEVSCCAQLMVDAKLSVSRKESKKYSINPEITFQTEDLSDDIFLPETDDLLQLAEQVHASRHSMTSIDDDIPLDFVDSLSRHNEYNQSSISNDILRSNSLKGYSLRDQFRNEKNSLKYPTIDFDTLNSHSATDITDNAKKSVFSNSYINSKKSSDSMDLFLPKHQDEYSMSKLDFLANSSQNISKDSDHSSRDSNNNGNFSAMETTSEDTEEVKLTYLQFQKLYELGLISKEQMRRGTLTKTSLNSFADVLKDCNYEPEQKQITHSDFDNQGDSSSIMDCGLKRVNSKRYKKEYVIGKPSTFVNPRKWDVNEVSPIHTTTKQSFLNTAGSLKRISHGDSFSSEDVIVSAKNDSLCETEEDIFNTSKDVFNMEERVKWLEEMVRNADESTTREEMTRLEKKVKSTESQIDQSNEAVSYIEHKVHNLNSDHLQDNTQFPMDTSFSQC